MDNIKIRLDLIDKAYTLLSGRHFSSKEEKTKLVACVIDNIVELTKQLNINKEKQK